MDLTATFTIVGSVAGVIIGFLTAWFILGQRRVAEKDLTLTAYANAVQGILDLKRSFAENPEIFAKQTEIYPKIKDYVPPYMDVPTFLTFAAGFWRFSYVYSVYQRAEELGIKEVEKEGLKEEMLLWLRRIPGFYDVYRYHVDRLLVHNQDFLKFLREVAYDPNNREWKEIRAEQEKAAAPPAIPGISNE